MTITRIVPLGSGLRAVADLHMSRKERTAEDQAFSEWYVNARHDCTLGSVLDNASLAVAALEDLLAHVPAGDMGDAWAAAMRQCLALTEQDTLRPFDRCVFDTDEERAAAQAIMDFAETVESTSPLLSDVADVVADQALNATCGPFDLGDVVLHRGLLLDEGLLLRRDPAHPDGWCDKHEAACYGDSEGDSVARWEHLDALVPGFEKTLRDLLAAFDEAVPETGEHDNGRARMVRRTD